MVNSRLAPLLLWLLPPPPLLLLLLLLSEDEAAAEGALLVLLLSLPAPYLLIASEPECDAPDTPSSEHA